MDLVFVDVETTGLDPERHELLEVAAVRVTANALDVVAQVELKVRAERLADADPIALTVNGYSADQWAEAQPLSEALLQVGPLLAGAIVAGHNVAFDWAFLERGFDRAGLRLPDVDYHRLDTASLAWPLFAEGVIDSLSLEAVCGALGVARPSPHRALSDAVASLEVARRLREEARSGHRLTTLDPDVRRFVEVLIDRNEVPEGGASEVDR